MLGIEDETNYHTVFYSALNGAHHTAFDNINLNGIE